MLLKVGTIITFILKMKLKLSTILTHEYPTAKPQNQTWVLISLPISKFSDINLCEPISSSVKWG